MSPSATNVVFFDLVETLGAERATWDGRRLAEFHPYRDVREILDSLRSVARVGVLVADRGITQQRLEQTLGGAAEVLGTFDDSLVVAAAPGPADPFDRALAAAGLGHPPERAVYVGLDATLRTRALAAGMRAAPHPALARAVLDGEDLHYVRLAAPGLESQEDWATVLAGRPIVPIDLTGEPDPVLYGIAAGSALHGLGEPVAGIELLFAPRDVAETGLYLLQLREAEVAASERLRDFVEGLRAAPERAYETAHGWIVAVPGSRSLDEFHPPDAGHGHTRVLLPSFAPLERRSARGKLAPRQLEPAERDRVLEALESKHYRTHLGYWLDTVPCSEVTPTPGPGAAQSRNIWHPGNALATEGLARGLANICGAAHVWRHTFQFLGQSFANVVAEIPGTSKDLVIVGAHFDSTAGNTPNYAAATDAAPGADDDASGVAGVLAIAEALKALSATSPPGRTLRFVLFNAEEQGRRGSVAYAKDLKSSGTSAVAAMFQMDMIGWNSDQGAKKKFEVHATGSDDYKSVFAGCRDVANLVIAAAAQVSPNLDPQRYPLGRSTTDPATNRSDHSSFQYQGWPACLVAEDLFADAGNAPKQTGNPHYHLATDVDVNVAYATDVVRAVAAAAWTAANP
jgi:hypothetical protein